MLPRFAYSEYPKTGKIKDHTEYRVILENEI